jgi:predicted ABC-type ATPase
MEAARTKRLRIFAGPNGAGKTSLYNYLINEGRFKQYFHINSDAIARDIPVGFDSGIFPFNWTEDELYQFLDSSPFQQLLSIPLRAMIKISNKEISLKDAVTNDITYLCAALAEFLRQKMIASNSSFSFESVFSHPSKIDAVRAAKIAGFITYLYIIATPDPFINIQRIKNRVENGGHNVPEEKTRERYYKTMENIRAAFLLADRVYFFDNSKSDANEAYTYFAEKRDNKITLTSDAIPQWFNTNILSGIEKKIRRQ